jgi:ectoine hydroxylase-related dioxygenase (phytanoyl-CoA dioxygenase family)
MEDPGYQTMSDRERYLFDLQGFLVVRGVLDDTELRALNESLDANRDRHGEQQARSVSPPLEGDHGRGHFTGMLTWDKPWCDPWRALLAHPKLIPHLNTLFGRGWKLDHTPDVHTATQGAEGLTLHGFGNVTFNGSRFYAYSNGTMRCGLLNCQFYLADQDAGDGGLMVIPGSHKANLRPSDATLRFEEDREICAHVPAKAGDVVLFNEATTHGTLPWRAAHERRVALYRFTPKYMHYTGGVYEAALPAWASELTPAQRAVLEPPYVYNRPLIEDDGERLVAPRREGE